MKRSQEEKKDKTTLVSKDPDEDKCSRKTPDNAAPFTFPLSLH